MTVVTIIICPFITFIMGVNCGTFHQSKHWRMEICQFRCMNSPCDLMHLLDSLYSVRWVSLAVALGQFRGLLVRGGISASAVCAAKNLWAGVGNLHGVRACFKAPMLPLVLASHFVDSKPGCFNLFFYNFCWRACLILMSVATRQPSRFAMLYLSLFECLFHNKSDIPCCQPTRFVQIDYTSLLSYSNVLGVNYLMSLLLPHYCSHAMVVQ